MPTLEEIERTIEGKELLKDQRSLEREINDLLLERDKIEDTIGRFNKSTEASLKQQLLSKKALLNLIKTEYVLIEDAQQAIAKSNTIEHRNTLANIEARIHEHNLDIAIIDGDMRYEIQIANEKIRKEQEWKNFKIKTAKELFGFQVKEYDTAKGIADILEKQGGFLEKYSKWIAVFATILSSAYNTFLLFDKSAWNFRKTMGVTRNDVEGIRTSVERLAIDYMHVGVTIDSAYESVLKLRDAMGSSVVITNDLIKTTALMSSQLGVSADITSGFLRNMSAITKSSMQSQEYTSYMAQNMAAATGVPLGEAMKDVAKASSVTLSMLNKYPNAIIRTAIEAKRMGSSLDGLAKTGAHILDFTTSINEEMEASVLIGRSLNLQYARELAYSGNLEEANKVLVQRARELNFESMDYFQKNAVAKAMGKSVEEMYNMIQAEQQWETARRSTDPYMMKRIVAYDLMRKSNEEMLKANSKNTALFIEQQSNQERIVAITQKWNQLLTKAGAIFFPFIDLLLDAVIPVMDLAQGIFSWIVAIKVATGVLSPFFIAIFNIGKVIDSIGYRISLFDFRDTQLVKVGNQIRNIGLTLSIWYQEIKTFMFGLNPIKNLFTFIETTVLGIGTNIGLFVNWIKTSVPLIGRIGNMFETVIESISIMGKKAYTVYNIIKGFISPLLEGAAVLGKMGGFLGSIVKIGSFFGKWLTPFGYIITVLQFIYNLFGRLHGIGEAFRVGIINGIWFGLKAIAGALYDTLIQPFVNVFNWIWNHLCGKSPSMIGLGIINGIASVGGMLFNVLTSPFTLAKIVIGKIFGTIGTTILNVGLFIFKWMTPIGLVSQGIKYWWNLIKGISFGEIISSLGSLGKSILNVGLFIFKWLTPIGLVIQGIQYVWNLIKGITFDRVTSSLSGVWSTIKSIGTMMLTLLDPISLIVKSFESLKNAFSFDTIKAGVGWMVDKVSTIAGLASKAYTGVSNMFSSSSVETQAATSYVPAETITSEQTKVGYEKTKESEPIQTETEDEEVVSNNDTLLQGILSSINSLNDNLLNGAICVKMDGQLLSTTLARNIEFRGAL